MSPDGYSILGDIKLMKGDIQESNELHNKVIELDPNYNIATRKNPNNLFNFFLQNWHKNIYN